MRDAAGLLLALAGAYGCAWIAPRTRRPAWGKAGAYASWAFVPLVLICPLLIPTEHVGLRAIAAVISGDLFFKMVDALAHGVGIGAVPLEHYDRRLIPFPLFATVPHLHARLLSRREDAGPQARRIVGGIAGFSLAVGALTACNQVRMVQNHYAVNHVALLLCFVVAIESLSQASCGVERLAGFDTRPIIDHAYRAGTVAEFWRRYNNRVHDWLHRNVFAPSRGWRHPVRSLFLVFLVSGLFHELMFGLATSRWTGHQLLFFTIQGPGALASGRLIRSGPTGKILARVFTIGFLGLTSVLFFEGVWRVFPFIYARPPLPRAKPVHP